MMNCFVVWLTDERRLALFPVEIIFRDPHHRESPTRREQGLNLRGAWSSGLVEWTCAVVITTTPWRSDVVVKNYVPLTVFQI